MRINGGILIPISHSEETKTNCGNTGIRENASPAVSAFGRALGEVHPGAPALTCFGIRRRRRRCVMADEWGVLYAQSEWNRGFAVSDKGRRSFFFM